MIITRTPFRISFAGGGSDLASFYEKHAGCVLSTSINKYMYVNVHPSFDSRKTILKYSRTEIVDDINNIEHNYFREILKRLQICGVEIASTADVPAGTGLGSSSAFAVGVLHTLYAYKSKYVSKERLAREACDVEIKYLRNPIGKQDQYAAAYGGLNFYTFCKNGDVTVEPVMMNSNAQKKLETNLMMFYTGKLHSASEILKEQKENITQGNREQSQIRMCELARMLRDELQNGNVDAIGEILHENWMLKKTLASGISNPEIDEIYTKAISAGALGGKLLGAGGGGFLLFYVPEQNRTVFRTKMILPEMKFNFDRQGSCVIYVGDKPE